MASTIQLKTGTGSAVPSSLTQGEVAINIDNGLIYYGSGSVNSVKQLETFTNITASGNISASGTIIATGAIQAESVTIGSGDSSVTGNITVAGNIEANGNIVGDTQTAIIGIKQITTSDFISGSQLISHTNITASNNISASGYVYAQRVFLNNNDTLRYSTANSGLYVNGGIQTIGNSTFGNANVDTHTFNGHITASVYNISASGIIANSLAGTLSTAAQPNITSLGTLSALQTSGDVTLGSGNSIVNSDSDETIISNGSTGFNIGQSDYPLTIVSNVTASGNISASGQVFSNTYYQWEATARCDTDDDSNWQGPNSKGLMSNEDWNQDYGTDYDGTSNNAESRLYMNTGWWVPHGANYSASIKSMDIYIQPNSNVNPHANDDFFSCSLWYSKASDLASELNVVGSNSGTFVQRHGASVNSDQFKASDEKLFRYNSYHVSQSINLDLAPGSMLFPRVKTGGTNNFVLNVYWIIHYCKKPL